jgi:Ohr subfamily peroxiredoxin
MTSLYTAEATAHGGREGKVETSDQKLQLSLDIPREMGGRGGTGTNPEQLFAAGYAACFHSAVKFVAGRQKLDTTDSTVTAKVGIGQNGAGGFALAVDLVIALPKLEREVAQKLVDTAHQVCPYSNATRNNIPVTLTLV